MILAAYLLYCLLSGAAYSTLYGPRLSVGQFVVGAVALAVINGIICYFVGNR